MMIRTGTRSGGKHRHSYDPVAVYLRELLDAFVKTENAKRIAANKAREEAGRVARAQFREERNAKEREKERRFNGKVIAKLLDMGQCGVRLKMRPLSMTRNDFMPQKRKRAHMRTTSWVFCKTCDAKGCDGWHRPFELLTPEELANGERLVPQCVHHCARVGKVPLCITVPESYKRARYACDVHDVPLVPSPPPAPPPPNLDDSLVSLIRDPWRPPPAVGAKPKPNAAAAAAAHIAAASEVEWKGETPLEHAQRQKAHGYKVVLGMSDEIFYKHLRDNVIDPKAAQAEVYKRKCCIRAGHSGKYEPPKSVKPTLGLLDGVAVPNPAPPPEANAPRPVTPTMCSDVSQGLFLN